MSVMINDPAIAENLLAARKATGLDRFDEVWQGVYMMVPAPNIEHQSLLTQLILVFGAVVDFAGLGVTLASVNVSDRREGWSENYRVPDLSVFLRETSAQDCGTHWLGGPDLALEITSPGDRTLEKLDFYAKVGTSELLVIDRDPWQLTLYRRTPDSRLTPVAINGLQQDSPPLVSQIIPLQFRLDARQSAIEIQSTDQSLSRLIPIVVRPAS